MSNANAKGVIIPRMTVIGCRIFFSMFKTVVSFLGTSGVLTGNVQVRINMKL